MYTCHELSTALLHAKTFAYNDHFSSSSLEQVISTLFQTCRSWLTFWTPCACLKINKLFLCLHLGIACTGSWKQYRVREKNIYVTVSQATCISCTLNFVPKVEKQRTFFNIYSDFYVFDSTVFSDALVTGSTNKFLILFDFLFQ